MQIQFLGLDEGADPKNLPPGTLVRAENLRMPKPRRLEKRYGTTGLVKTLLAGGNVAAGKSFISSGSDPVISNGETAYTYAAPLAKWVPLDRPPSLRITKRALADSTRSVTALDLAVYGDMLVTLYASGGIFVTVERLSTGQVVLPPTAVVTPVSTDKNPRVLIEGTTAYLLYSTTSGTVGIALLSLTTLVLTTGVSLVANAAAGTQFDAVIGTPTAGVATLYLLYELAAGASRLRTASFTLSTLAAIATQDRVGTSVICMCVAFCPIAQVVAVAWSVGDVRLVTFDTGLAGAISATVPEPTVPADFVFVAEDSGTNLLLGWTRNDGNSTDADRLTTALYATAGHALVATSRRITFGLFSPSKPWRTSSRWYVAATAYVHPYDIFATEALAQASSVVVEIETAASLSGAQDSTHPHVGTLENQTGWYATVRGLTKPAVDSSGNVWIAATYRNREPANYASYIPVGWSIFKVEVAAALGGTQLGAATLCAGGAPFWNDGASTMPYGFAHAPQLVGCDPAAGGAVVAGVYSYVATYAWRDANGLLHRSMPSPPRTVTTAGGNLSVALDVATSSLSAKLRTLTSTTAANPVLVELWRTTIGGTGPHYRLTLEPLYQVLVNNARTDVVTLVDTKADANISSGSPLVPLNTQAQLYTDLGELENVPPPSFITVATHRGRLAGIGPDLRTVWLSKDSTLDATLAPGFHEALTLAFASDKTALASLDTVLVVFGKDSIDVVQGDGPDDKGDQNTWSIQAVQTDVGCVNARSVVTSPMGAVFESRRGLELLDRSLNVTWLGKGAADTLALYPTITSAVLVAEQHEVRFTCDDGANGIVLAYDYHERIWFTRKYTDASDTLAASIRFVDAALIDGVYTMLTAGGQVYRETTASSLDGGNTYVSTDILLAHIHAQPGRSGWSNDNLGWSRVKDLTLMGTSVAPHDLAVSFAVDYANTYGQTHTFLANASGTPTAVGPLEKARVTCAVQKCQSIQIRIRDLTPTGGNVANTSAGTILESLSLRVGAKDGPAKTSAGQQG